MAAEPTPHRARGVWAQRWYGWWPPVAAFFAVLLGVPALVAGAAWLLTGDDDRYSLQPTMSCLDARDRIRVTSDDGEIKDFIASSAPGGAMKVKFPRNVTVVSFGVTTQDAERTYRAYLRFAGGTIPVQDLLFREENVVLLWETPPSERDRLAVRDCLR
jgi:hypothetical protein